MSKNPEINVHDSLTSFAEAVMTTLEENEASNSFILGRMGAMLALDQPNIMLMARVHEDGVTKLAALGLGDGLVMSKGDPLVAELIAEEVHSRGLPVARAFGPVEVVTKFGERLSGLRDCAWSETMSQRVYQTNQITAPLNVPGSMRVGSQSDLDVLTKWMVAFVDDANLGYELSEAAARENIEPKFKSGTIFVWERDGQPVSMASSSRPTKTTMTVNAVYTPPEERNRGYASALVAAVSEHILRSGKRYAVLLTDQKNPTSNSIYMKIGYVPVSDSLSIQFAPKVSSGANQNVT